MVKVYQSKFKILLKIEKQIQTEYRQWLPQNAYKILNQSNADF